VNMAVRGGRSSDGGFKELLENKRNRGYGDIQWGMYTKLQEVNVFGSRTDSASWSESNDGSNPPIRLGGGQSEHNVDQIPQIVPHLSTGEARHSMLADGHVAQMFRRISTEPLAHSSISRPT
jgi:hypothetical protein